MENDQFMLRLSNALNKPIQTRCAELTVLFDRGHLKELNDFFPILVDNIFGPQGTISCGLKTTTEVTNNADFQALHHFLSPTGPVFKLIYLLLKECGIKYDFNVAFLPTKVRQTIETGTCSPFYGDMLYISPQTKHVTSLLLNPFDYYMFHFAFYLINPWHQKTTALPSNWSTVYYILCCDYVLHFLPTDPRSPILPIINYYIGKHSSKSMPVIQSPPQQIKLLRNSLFKDSINDYNFNQDCLPKNDTWRSETVLTVFIDMWLNNDQVVMNKFDFSLNPNKSIRPNELPSGEYIRILRVFVKQLHAFSSSGKLDDTHLGDLKRCSIKMMQGKMYQFLRNIIHQWPLDGSFRLVLELWLSFIQPWRYPGNAHMKHLNLAEANPEPDENAVAAQVDREYLPFIADNLLSYIVIFQQLLPRFMRVDLSSPKNSHMLYRLTKVFDQPNLVILIKEIESYIHNSKESPSHTFGTSWSSKLPPLSPTSAWSTNMSANDSAYFNTTMNSPKSFITSSPECIANLSADNSFKISANKIGTAVRNSMFELEGPNFSYKPLFYGQPPAQEVFELIALIKKAQYDAHIILESRLAEIEKQKSGFFGFFKSIFLVSDLSNDEFSLDERKKVPSYLEMSYEYLVNIFNIRERVENMNILFKPTISLDTTESECVTPDNISYLLTPERVRQRIRNVKYEGDPDLQPVRTTENKFLVRCLYMIAKKLNDDYKPFMVHLYRQNTFMGSVARQILQPPLTVYKYNKTIPGRSPRQEEHLPPRLSFRAFASHKVMFYLSVFIIIAYVFGYNPVITLCFLLFLWSIIILLKAAWSYRNVFEPSYLDVSDFQ